MSEALNKETITFGKYKNLTLDNLLRDRKYCKWLLKQDWFATQYEYLYNRVKEYVPSKFFLLDESKEELKDTHLPVEDFIEKYKYFQLLKVNDVKVELKEDEKKCYEFYLSIIDSLKEKILTNKDVNPYSIKAPTSWLKKFTKKYELSPDVFKSFLASYELPNIPYIVEDIKKMGGIEYKGAKSYLIAKKKSLKQEQFWEKLLKKKYGEEIGVQFKKDDCFFDYINIRTNTVYEAKLGLKDFDIDQYNRYKRKMKGYRIIYLIDNDCIVDLKGKHVFTTNRNKYELYLLTCKEPTKLEKKIRKYEIKEVDDMYENL